MTARNFSTIAAASKAVNFVLAETSYWGRGQHARAWSRAQPSELQATPTPAAPPGGGTLPKDLRTAYALQVLDRGGAIEHTQAVHDDDPMPSRKPATIRHTE
ncbi:hypothetical protein [Variovorax sp. UC74_104]|uniref:hypothetical protein n=1 Tax=Variovorax sp. UC74_104 TaxID=3374555 RepID=UPI003757E546